MKHSSSKILKFKSIRDPIKVLGYFLWLSRDLTLYGRSLLAKSLGVSQLVYIASMLSVPTSIIRDFQTDW